MSEPKAERIHRGTCASPGLAAGPLVRATPLVQTAGARNEGPEKEKARLTRALDEARRGLAALMEKEGGEVSEILEFQLEMAGDEELVGQAFEAVDAGASASKAWWTTLDAHIQDYRDAADEYFRARSADLTDLRERVAVALGALVAGPAALPPGAILLDDDLTPTRFLDLDWQALDGIALVHGSATSHVAMLARARGVPMLTGLGEDPAETGRCIIDARDGVLITDPAPGTSKDYEERLARWRRDESEARKVLRLPAVTAAGDTVAVMINVDRPEVVDDQTLAASDGVGLMRTEFLYMNGGRPPDEDTQFRVYINLLDRLGGKPCVIRTLDVGGDKPVAGLTFPDESNPFLGLRGIRLTLDAPDVFRPQVRALLRAAAVHPLKVMLPMIATPAEYREALDFFEAELADLRGSGIAAELPPLGIMVETPACAITIDTFDVPFYSIGSNDLAQYVMAASRDGAGRVAALNDPAQPAVLRLIEAVIRHGRASGRPVSLCGDMGSDPGLVHTLLSLGLDTLSVAPAALGRVKLAVRAFGSGEQYARHGY